MSVNQHRIRPADDAERDPGQSVFEQLSNHCTFSVPYPEDCGASDAMATGTQSSLSQASLSVEQSLLGDSSLVSSGSSLTAWLHEPLVSSSPSGSTNCQYLGGFQPSSAALQDQWGSSHGYTGPSVNSSYTSMDDPFQNTSVVPMTEDTLEHPGAASGNMANLAKAMPPPPKVGSRFSRESSKFLKQWLATHEGYPYPSKEEMKTLQSQTGLNKTQIKNWMTNTRRRQKNFGSSHKTSPYTYPQSSGADPVDIPRRPGTPAVKVDHRSRSMNPMQRWVDSPPKDEPAAIGDIANAVASTNLRAEKDRTVSGYDDGSGQSIDESSASSRGTSSGSSFASAYSHNSGDSLPHIEFRRPPQKRSRRQRRSRKKPQKASIATVRQYTYQCTFCSETFTTKYDWQRHEKSLHIPLDRWVCAPDGPRAVNPNSGQLSCVFCGEPEPAEEHLEAHYPSVCQERAFNRKDHLRQHLRLVHNAGLIDWSTDSWMMPTPEIRSRCGFCGSKLGSWVDRVEHLAEHFKLGSTMADWTGDWGFDKAVLQTLENSIPPYLIHNERTSPYPFQASGVSPESPKCAYELLTLELSCFLENHQARTGQMPDSKSLQVEACRIVLASELLSGDFIGLHPSWLRDLITSDEESFEQARCLPIRTPAEGRLRSLEIRGRTSLFEGCQLEVQLRSYVAACQGAGSVYVSDMDLQQRACQIIVDMEENVDLLPPDYVFSWLIGLCRQSTKWLANFRQRVALPTSKEPDIFDVQGSVTSTMTKVDSLAFDIHGCDASAGAPAHINTIPDYDTLLIGEHDHFGTKGSGTSYKDVGAARDPSARALAAEADGLDYTSRSFPDYTPEDPSSSLPNDIIAGSTMAGPDSYQRPAWLKKGNYILNDPNFHQWLGRELGRWVAATMSPDNPNSHVPSDDEIQRQARLLLYDVDDPWEQTAADHAEWLARLKQDLGIFPDL